MTRLLYGAVREHPRKVIHVVRVVDELLEMTEIDDLAARMRERALARHGDPDAAVVVVQGAGLRAPRFGGLEPAEAHS